MAISYNLDGHQIFIQVVLLDKFTLSQERIEIIKEKLFDFDVTITELHLTKDQFNESKGEWQPQYYNWLDFLLLSKAEAL